MTPQRSTEIDLLRTVAIVLMVVYHGAFDLAQWYGFPIRLDHPLWSALQRTSASLFLLLVGVSFVLSWSRMHDRGLPLATKVRRTSARAVRIGCYALLITIVTLVAVPDQFIRFGILHLIALAVLVLPAFLSLREGNVLIGAVIFLLGGRITAFHGSVLLLPLGITPVHFTTLDYFPVFPWFGLVLIGLGIGHLLFVRWTAWPRLRSHSGPQASTWHWLALPGRYSLLLYLVHQPILLAVLFLLYGKPSFS